MPKFGKCPTLPFNQECDKLQPAGRNDTSDADKFKVEFFAAFHSIVTVGQHLIANEISEKCFRYFASLQNNLNILSYCK